MGARFFPLEVERNDTGKQSGKTIRVGMVLRGAHTSHRRALARERSERWPRGRAKKSLPLRKKKSALGT